MRKSLKSWFPIKSINEGIIENKKGEYLKILEVLPVNFELKSYEEKESILYSYKTFLKTCNFDIQILVKSKKNDLEDHISSILKNVESENLPALRLLGDEYIKMVNENTLKNTITRKFFLVFFAETNGNKKITRDMAITDLKEKTSKIKLALEKCGNEVVDLAEDNFYIIDNLYKELNRNISQIQNIGNGTYEKY